MHLFRSPNNLGISSAKAGKIQRKAQHGHAPRQPAETAIAREVSFRSGRKPSKEVNWGRGTNWEAVLAQL